MEDRGLSLLLLFEGDPIAYKIALTNHSNIVLVFHDHVCVLADPTLYHKALSESPWDVVLVENLALGAVFPSVIKIKYRAPHYERKMSLEEGVAKIEGILEQMDKRLNHLETELRDLRRDLNHRFFWLLGVQMSMWITIILAILLH